jgi:asparagine synthase (glutamine-hydrolysing)
MCGIAGFLGGSAATRADFLRAAQVVQAHRGPDGAAIWNPDGPIGLAHRRLAIVDLSAAGAQPMRSADQRWTLSYNGEIYNAASLRAALDPRATWSWRGHSDSEVLIEAISRWGVAQTLPKLDGMFAFAAWDAETRALWLARDRYGEKPLCVAWLDGGIAFASELTALRRHAKWRGEIDAEARDELLAVGYIAAPRTIFRDAYKLPAGALLCLDDRTPKASCSLAAFRAQVVPWWQPATLIEPLVGRSDAPSVDVALNELSAHLDDAVARRMVADVPVGALLSGGLDSGLVVSSMVRVGGARVRTFSVGFEDPAFDESDRAAAVARFLGTDHTTLSLTADAALAAVPAALAAYDEPFADAAAVPALLIARAARSQVTVALTGDAGDEFFGGYRRYRDAISSWRAQAKLPVSWRRGAARSLGAVAAIAPASRFSQRAARHAERLGAATFADHYQRFLRFPHALSPPRLPPAIPAWIADPSSQMRWVDQSDWLPDGIHVKLDRASMRAGLELRVPLLDAAIVALSWSTARLRVPGVPSDKSLLRALWAQRMPVALSAGRKRGFDVPISRWLRGPLKPWAADLLHSAAVGDLPAEQRTALARLWSDHQNARRDGGFALWAALAYVNWTQQL